MNIQLGARSDAKLSEQPEPVDVNPVFNAKNALKEELAQYLYEKME